MSEGADPPGRKARRTSGGCPSRVDAPREWEGQGRGTPEGWTGVVHQSSGAYYD